jgi:hypothetical protein
VLHRVAVAAQIVVDVAEVEVRLEEAVVEADRALVERLRLGQFVPGVAQVGQVDERGDQIGIVVQRLAIGDRRFLLPFGRAVVEQRSVEEVLFGARQRPAAAEGDVGGRRAYRRRRRLAPREALPATPAARAAPPGTARRAGVRRGSGAAG